MHYFSKFKTLKRLDKLDQAIGNNTQNHCNNNNNNGQKTYWLLKWSIIAPQKYYCNNAIIQCVNLINLYGGFPIFASKMGEVGKCVRII